MHDDRIYQDLVNAYYNLYEARVDDNLTPSQKNEEVVIEYLLDEGIADSEEGAEIIMQNMSEEWYNFIVEGLPKTATMSTSEMSNNIAALRKQQQKLTAQLDLKNPQPAIVKKIQKIIAEIKRLQAGASSNREITGLSADRPKRSPEESDPESKMSPEEREAFRQTRLNVPTRTPEERAKLQADIKAGSQKAQKLTHTSSPQKEAPGRETPAQIRARKAGEGLISPERDPSGSRMTFYTPSGEEERLNLTNQGTVKRSGTRQNPIINRYGQGSADSTSTRGPTPAGSTVNERQKGPRGTGRRPQQ